MTAQPTSRMCVTFRRAVLIVVAIFVTALAAFAGPEGAAVVQGTAHFDQSGNYTAITVSDKAIINYTSFDIARPQTVEFIQPGASASVLNRILSANPTVIDGTLLANGRVFFVNPAGVLFGESAQVNVTQLVASALNISDADFTNGRYDFQGGQGDVINRGNLSAEQVALIGKRVANLGKIDCPGGAVVLVAGDRVFLGEPGTDLLVEIDPSVSPDNAQAVEGSAVLNEGSVEVGGGSMVLAAAGDVYSLAISNVGKLSASTPDGDAGTVKLDAPDGTVVNTGSITATSESGKGGNVQVLGDRVGLFEDSAIDVSGTTGGGSALVGGDYKGQGEVPTASRTVVGPDAVIRADATEDGDGGTVVVWSDEVTKFYGHASAVGAGDGDGGLVEVSSRQDLNFAGAVALGSPAGKGGTLLLDPATITITDGGEDGSLPDDVGFGDEPTDATISERTLENTASGSNAEIVLEAWNDITIENLTDNALTLSPGVSLVLRTRNDPSREENPDGGITMDMGDSIVTSGGGNITLQAGHNGDGFVANSVAHIVAGSLVTGGGSVTVQAAGSVDVRRVSTAGAANSAGGTVLLEASKSTEKSSLTVENGINANGGPDADGSGANAAGPVTLSGTAVRISGSVTAVGGDDNGLNAQGGAGGPVTFNGATYLEHASVNSSGGAGNTPGNGGAITFNGRLYLGGDSTLTAGTGNVTFHGQVDDLGDPNTGEPSGLSINSAGVTRFDAVVGGSWPLGSLTTDAPGRTEINANITTGAAEGVPATQTYNDPVVTTNDLVLEDLGTGGISFKSSLTLGGDLTVAAENGDVTFLGTVDDDDGSPLPDAGLLVHSAGITRFSAAVGGIHPIGHLYTDAPGTTEIGANITTNWTALYDDPVVLTNDVALTNWGTSGIRFNSTVSGNGQGPWDLTVAGPGSAEFLDTVTLGGGDLNVTAGWYITAYDVTTRGGVNTNGGNVSLTSLGGDVSVHGTIDTSGGNAVSSAVGPDAGGVAIESQAPEGTVTVHDIIAEGGNTDVTYAEGSVGDYAVGGDGGSVSISGARINADGFITTGQGLGITTITRTDDGGAVLPPLVYAMDGAGGSVQINGPLALDGDLTITAGTGDVVFLGPIDAMYGEGLVNANLMVNSASMTRFESPVGQQYPIESLTTDWPGWTEISANITTGGAGGGAATQTYNDPVVMTNNVELMDLGADGIYFNDSLSLGGDLHVTAVNGDVRFQGTIDDDGISETSSVLYVESGRTTRFNAPVGGSHPIDSLWTRTSLGAGAQATTYINGNITTRDGIQMYYHPVILENSVTLTDTGTNGIYFTDPVSGDGQGPWNLAVVTTDPQAQIQFNGPVTLDGGLRANAAGDIYANQLTSARNNIELRSTQGDLRLYGPINADRDGQGYGGGVSLIADSGRVHNGDGFLDVAITGYSDGTRGVDLPYGRGKAAIRIDSAEDLTLGSNCVLTARGVYSGRRIDLGTASDLYPDGFWARTMTYYDDDNPRPMDWAYASNVDDRSSVGFRTDSYYGGMPMDVAVYLCSSTGEVRIDSPAMVPDGATVVVDAYDAYTFDDMFTIGSEFPSTSRLEVVLRGAPDAGTPQEESDWLDGFTGYSAVLRSGALATVGQTQEWWQGPQEPSPPPLPVLIVPPVVPPIVLERPEGPDWLRLAEGVVGPIVPPSPDCVDVKETEIELLRKCQVACDLFSTDVSLVPTAEDIVTLDRRLKTRLEEILPRLSALSRKWPQPGKADLPAIEDVLQRDEALGGWLHDGVELVEIAKKKLRPTSTSDLVGGIVRMYLGSADGLVRDFVRAYFRSKLAAAAEQTTPRA